MRSQGPGVDGEQRPQGEGVEQLVGQVVVQLRCGGDGVAAPGAARRQGVAAVQGVGRGRLQVQGGGQLSGAGAFRAVGAGSQSLLQDGAAAVAGDGFGHGLEGQALGQGHQVRGVVAVVVRSVAAVDGGPAGRGWAGSRWPRRRCG